MTPAAYAVLNLDAVRHNLSKVRSCAPDAKVMAVIKANGYGHGLLRIAEALQYVDAFAVARVDEGIRLRKAGFENRIAVLEGFTCAEEFDELLHYQLDAVVHSLTQLEILEAGEVSGACAVWLKLDTGMNRLGFKAKEFSSAYQRLSQCVLIKQPINLMTHFACADDFNDDKTLKQISLFNEAVAGLSGERSMANSAGILGWKQSLSDWVRPGIMLYGISPFPESTGRQLGLKPVMELHSRLIAVKQIEAGDTVGYGGSWICEKQTTMGVAAIGYGDGYPRYAKAGTPVLVNGKRFPLIGRVSMDMITIDLGNQVHAQPGDPVTLWGKGLPVEEIACWAGTIPYALVCGVTQRVQLVEKQHELSSAC
ncbi:alanine racemase [Methylobacter sp.]|uniref:alanine racemase n=1 Tax=Methylobacter sp. TaxID=2051955 RepID=UPI001208063C|nr:alanine racemase [Methylobacter sp.]TAK61751.1 MAG: alanine racemase [Methylobacter sp.]